MQQKVYVVQETSHDFSGAEAFGDLKFLSVDKTDDFHNLANSEHNQRLLAHLRHGLRDFSKYDFLILTGSPYVSAAVMWILGQRGQRQVNILRWDNRDRVYVPLPMQF